MASQLLPQSCGLGSPVAWAAGCPCNPWLPATEKLTRPSAQPLSLGIQHQAHPPACQHGPPGLSTLSVSPRAGWPPTSSSTPTPRVLTSSHPRGSWSPQTKESTLLFHLGCLFSVGWADPSLLAQRVALPSLAPCCPLWALHKAGVQLGLGPQRMARLATAYPTLCPTSLPPWAGPGGATRKCARPHITPRN